ncbi:hypothetical protein [Brevundimonas sp.]|nr:hypothetical protein [Brevundimonas sp.]MBJ7485965.1 hypothetical protein [Brevundimonas sp.]
MHQKLKPAQVLMFAVIAGVGFTVGAGLVHGAWEFAVGLFALDQIGR